MRTIFHIALIFIRIVELRCNVVIFSHIGSHFTLSSVMAQELSGRGYNVTIVAPVSCIPNDTAGYRTLPYAIDNQELQKELEQFKNVTLKRVSSSSLFLKVGRIITKGIFKASPYIISELKKLPLKVAVVDTAIVDALFLVHQLGVPFVMFSSSRLDVHLARIYDKTIPLSLVPVGRQHNGFTHDMTFYQRMSNLWNYIVHADNVQRRRKENRELIEKHFPQSSNFDINQLLEKAMLWIVNSDFNLEFPYPRMPNIQYVGSLTADPASTLNKDFSEFVDFHSDNGVIVVSLSTLFASDNDEIITKFLEVLEQLPHGVIWKRKSPPSKLSRLRFVNWMPLNDLLGHPNVKLLVTNGGQNSIQEAMYHGVPMVVLPLFGDQPDNAIRVEERGYGLRLSPFNLTSSHILKTFSKILYNSSYMDRMKSVSEMIQFQHSRRSGKQMAADWIEHVMRFNSLYLISPSKHMHWFEIHSLDVLACAIISLVFCGLTLYQICSFAFNLSFLQRNLISKYKKFQ